jgi:hypothetical protein
VSRNLDRLDVTFDDEHLVASAGLLLVSTVSDRLGISGLVDESLTLDGPGAASPGRKLLSVVHAMTAGADCIDDINMLRSGGTEAVLGHQPMAASTVGTFLRSFTFGHVSQLESVAGKLLGRAWQLGAGPTGTLIIDVDSTISEVHSSHKQGANRTYTRVWGLHPLLAVRADTGEVLGTRLRRGAAHTNRGSVRFMAEVINRTRRAGADGPIIVRADSGFYSKNLLARLSKLGVGFSIAIKLWAPVQAVIDAIPESAWHKVDYDDGIAQVAETIFGGRRLIVRRVRNRDRNQGTLFATWDYHAFATNLAGSAWRLDQQHRHHAVVELAIRDLKAGPMAHFPSAKFAANAAWLACAAIAHNLIRWTANLGGTRGTQQLLTIKTFRKRFLQIPGRFVRPAGRPTLRLPARWPWQTAFNAALTRVRALATPG